ncbi:MAG: hypothetical protein WBA17_09495 [Saprospiraceae bacterium]
MIKSILLRSAYCLLALYLTTCADEPQTAQTAADIPAAAATDGPTEYADQSLIKTHPDAPRDVNEPGGQGEGQLHPCQAAVLKGDQVTASITNYGGYGQRLDPPMASYEAQQLAKAYWVFEYYVGSGAQKDKGCSRGWWYQFRPDGTFTSGHWSETTNSGMWYLRFEDAKTFLTLDSNVDALDNEYEIQGISAKEGAMSWVETDRYHSRSVMIKTMSLDSAPTKKQFGLE